MHTERSRSEYKEFDKELAKIFGAVFKDTREKKGCSQQSVADAIGVHFTQHSAVERGKSLPSISTVLYICEALRTDPMDIFTSCLTTAQMHPLWPYGRIIKPKNAVADLQTEESPFVLTKVKIKSKNFDEKLGQTFGEELRNAREKKGWSQGDLSEVMGMHATHISFTERGESLPTISKILHFCAALRADPVDIFASCFTKMQTSSLSLGSHENGSQLASNEKPLANTKPRLSVKNKFVSKKVEQWSAGREDMLKQPMEEVFSTQPELVDKFKKNGIIVFGKLAIYQSPESLRKKGFTDEDLEAVTVVVNEIQKDDPDFVMFMAQAACDIHNKRSSRKKSSTSQLRKIK